MVPTGSERELSQEDRRRAKLLLLHPNGEIRRRLRKQLKSLAFRQFSEASSHGQAIELLKERHFSHIFFESKSTNVAATDFVKEVLRDDDQVVLVALSELADAENVFELLRFGARGYLLLPASAEMVDMTVTFATKGKQFDPHLLHAKDRNLGLAAIVASALDDTARMLRSVTTEGGSNEEREQVRHAFRQTIKMARLFAKGGSEQLADAFQKHFLELANGPATKLGRLRHQLRQQRYQETKRSPIQSACSLE